MIEIYNSDCFEKLKDIESESVDCIINDPPYFLSNSGITCKSGKMVSVNKGEWDKSNGYNETYEFNYKWISESYRILKDGGTLWVSGTYHNIYIIGSIIQSINDFKILNNITWIKKSPPPNLSCRFFTHSTETILWVRKGLKSKHTFNYVEMKKQNDNKQMKDVWLIGRPKKIEQEFGKHPTQKPLELFDRLILSSTNENDIVLDMFMGSGSSMVSCKKNKRRGIGIEIDKNFFNLSKKRIEND
jgi:site-specific DNA-methyltransferase (adenine-specific)